MLYSPKGVYGWIISIKTWHSVAHVEAYVGHTVGGNKQLSVASRDGVGVGQYDTRFDGLIHIMRPVVPFAIDTAMQRFRKEWQGQGYDWLGLIRFGWRAPVSNLRFNNKQFCSEFLARWYRAGGLDAFNGDDPDAIAPSDFLKSVAFKRYDVKDNAVVAVETAGV
jgi:hypothetical protein